MPWDIQKENYPSNCNRSFLFYFFNLILDAPRTFRFMAAKVRKYNALSTQVSVRCVQSSAARVSAERLRPARQKDPLRPPLWLLWEPRHRCPSSPGWVSKFFSTSVRAHWWDFFSGQECVGHSFAFVAHFCIFERCLDSNPQGAAVASRCAANNVAAHFIRNLATHLPTNLATHLPTNLATHIHDLATHLHNLAAHFPDLATHLPNLATHTPGKATHLLDDSYKGVQILNLS